MTPEERRAIRDRYLESSPGHWQASSALSPSGLVLVRCGGMGDATFGSGQRSLANAEFTAHAHQDVPALLAHADALQARLDAAEADRDQLRAIFERDVLTDSEAMRLAYERGKADRSAASHLETIREAYDRCGVEYVVRERGEWTYLFYCNSVTRLEFEQADLDDLCRTAQFSEFRGGAISSI